MPFSEPRSAAGLKKYADIATALALPSASVNLPPVTSSIKTRKDKNGSQRKAFYYGTKWTMTDPVTGKTFQARVSIPVDRCNVKLEVPTLPTNVAGKDEEPELHPECPADREEEHKWAARVTRFVTSQLYGKLATKVSYDMLMNAQKERFLGGAHAQSGPYNGKPLFQLRFEGQETSRVISIYPHREVTKTLQWTSEEVDPGSADRLLPPIRIRPATIARCKPVLSAITQTWLSEAKILEAWKIGCMFADEINQSDSSDLFQSHLCTCTAESTHKLAHPCDRCGKPEICAALEHSNFGGRNCRSCNAGQSGGSDIMVRRVTDAAISEAKLLRKDADWRDIEKASMVEYLQAKYQNEDGKWKSAYTSRVLEVVDQGKARAKHPGMPSLDAIKQIHRMKDGTMRLHVNENVAPCELAFNYLKHIYPAGILAIVKEWVNSKKKEADREHLLNKMALLFEVHRKLPYRKSARVGEHMSESQWSILEHELLTCQVQPHSKQAPSRKHPIFEEIRPDWKPKNAETIERVIAEIETLFGSNVPRLSGCPFPFRDSSAVEEWTWWTAWKLFGRRVHRTWLLCNGKWIQLDGIVTVFLECIWAYFTQENADSLDLPAIMTIQDARHPLRFAFGKIHHNDGMRTRFTKPLPENINDRDDERVNFSIEAEIANRFKHDFDEDFYGYLGQLIKDVELDVELYNPDAQLIEQTDEELLGSAEAQIQTEGGLVIGDNFYENGNLMVRADGEEEPEWHGQDQYDNGSAESDEED